MNCPYLDSVIVDNDVLMDACCPAIEELDTYGVKRIATESPLVDAYRAPSGYKWITVPVWLGHPTDRVIALIDSNSTIVYWLYEGDYGIAYPGRDTAKFRPALKRVREVVNA